MKILVTGGAGFIGSNVVDGLIAEGHEVAVVDDLSTGLRKNLNEKAKFFEQDITDKEALAEIFSEFQPEAIHHLAAQASVRRSVEEPAEDVKINVVGTINLLDLAVSTKVKKIIFSSTGGAIYGDGVDRPTKEGAKEEPICPYGIDKLLAEKYINYYAAGSSLKAYCLRYANVYGPRQNPKGEAGVVAIFAGKLLKNEPIDITGDGEQTRDFVYVADVVSANLAALNSDKPGVYNIGTGQETNINEIARLMKELSRSQSEIKHGPKKPGEQMLSCLDPTLAKSKLGWAPKINIEEGLGKTITYFKDVG